MFHLGICFNVFDTTGTLNANASLFFNSTVTFTCDPNYLLWPEDLNSAQYTCNVTNGLLSAWSSTFQSCTRMCLLITAPFSSPSNQNTCSNSSHLSSAGPTRLRPHIGEREPECLCSPGTLPCGHRCHLHMQSGLYTSGQLPGRLHKFDSMAASTTNLHTCVRIFLIVAKTTLSTQLLSL